MDLSQPRQRWSSGSRRWVAADTQRLALTRLLFDKGDRHVTAEQLHGEVLAAAIPVSLATVYNTLHQFTEAGCCARSCRARRPIRHQHDDPHHFFSESSARCRTSRCGRRRQRAAASAGRVRDPPDRGHRPASARKEARRVFNPLASLEFF